MEFPKLHYAVETLHQQYLKRQQLRADLITSAKKSVAARRFREAIDRYKELLASKGTDEEIVHELAKLYLRQKRYRQACDSLTQCLKTNPHKAEYHFEFGRALRRCGYPQEALREYLQRTKLDSNGSLAAGRPGPIEGQSGGVVVLHQAAEVHDRLAKASKQLECYLGLGHVRLAQNQLTEATRAYEAALKIEPKNVTALESLAFVLKRTGKSSLAAQVSADAYYWQKRYGDAVACYRRVLRSGVGELPTYERLAACYYKLHKYRSVIGVCKEGTAKYKTANQLYSVWVSALSHLGRTEEAINCAAQACEFLPDNLQLAVSRYLSLPVVYRTSGEVAHFRSRFVRGLEHLSATFDLEKPGVVREALHGIQGNFYLAYQGHNDRRLQKRHGEFVTGIMRNNYPKWSKPLAMQPLLRGERIRVGYLSSHLGSHTVGKLFLGWLTHHDREQFDVHVYYPKGSKDLLSGEVENVADRFYLLPKFEDLCERVYADKLHILVIPDIGMDPIMTKIGGLRLAPVQCMSWGHPSTSGLPNIDYFISSDLMEPSHAQDHYSETLVRLPGIGICVSRPFLGEARKARSEFGLPEEAILYLSPQSVFKYLPQYDYLYPAIARRVPKCRFVFLADRSPELTNIFRKRLLAAFRCYALNGSEYLEFLPHQDHLSYLQLNRVSDVFLDTLGWSGGLTTLEALGCSLPVVTCPGEFMRGRHSFAFLKRMGVTDTVARNMDEYIEIAVKLGTDEDWRRRISDKLRQRLDRLYDDEACVRALERFYRRIVTEPR